MATYAKVLKDTSGNQILPYTRSKLVYMDDNTTLETAISNLKSSSSYTLPTASSSTLGGVKIGSNINMDIFGSIYLNDTDLGTKGVVQIGNNIAVAKGGKISVYDASTTLAGVVQIGSNITAYNKTSASHTIISINKDNVTNALEYTPANKSSFEWNLIARYSVYTTNPGDRITPYLTSKFPSGSINDFALYKKGTRYYLYLYSGGGEIQAGASGFCELFQIVKTDDRPAINMTCPIMINTSTTGQVFSDAICEISSSGSIKLILGQGNRKIGNSSYPWVTKNGTTISWETSNSM